VNPPDPAVMKVRRVVAHRLKRERARRRLSQEGLAERLGLTPNYVAHLERGTRGLSLRTLVRIAERLGQPLHDLLRPAPGPLQSPEPD